MSTICFTHFNWRLQFALPTLTDIYNLFYPLEPTSAQIEQVVQQLSFDEKVV